MIARAAYFIGEPLWKGTVLNEMREHCDLEIHAVRSCLVEDGRKNTRCGELFGVDS